MARSRKLTDEERHKHKLESAKKYRSKSRKHIKSYNKK